MVSATRILGYTDRISVEPGDTVAFKISCDDVPQYHADIVRLVCADPDPSGPGLRYDTLTSDATGSYAGRHQPAQAGSYAFVPPNASLVQRGGISLGGMIFPTLPGQGPQTIFSQWNEAAKKGYVLGLDNEGALCLKLGDGQGHLQIITTATPLPERQWAYVAFSIDAVGGNVRLHQEILKPLALAPAQGSAAERLTFECPETSGLPLSPDSPDG